MELKWVNENVIEPFKNREVDLDKTVEVYRCLNRKGKVYSIKQGGKIVGHTSKLKLRDAKFVIHKAGQERCKVTGTNNSHALVRGKIDAIPLDGNQHMNKVTYDPYNDTTYMCHTTGEPFEIHHATSVNFTKIGVFVIPID
jgi:hypothetical protein